MVTILWYLVCTLAPIMLWLWDEKVSQAASLAIVVLAMTNLFVKVLPVSERHSFVGLTLAIVLFIVGPFLTYLLVGTFSGVARIFL